MVNAMLPCGQREESHSFHIVTTCVLFFVLALLEFDIIWKL